MNICLAVAPTATAADGVLHFYHTVAKLHVALQHIRRTGIGTIIAIHMQLTTPAAVMTIVAAMVSKGPIDPDMFILPV